MSLQIVGVDSLENVERIFVSVGWSVCKSEISWETKVGKDMGDDCTLLHVFQGFFQLGGVEFVT